MNNIALYRKDKQKWHDVSYSCAKSKKRGHYDSNEKLRYSVLISIQYDFQKSDEAFIRFLLEQEVLALENDSFQGISDALKLASYLLVKFNNPHDIPLFCRAKFANFDTACGFSREFMYLALREKTEDFVLQNYPDIYSDIEGDYIELCLEETLDEWWNYLSRSFPENEADEPLLELFERNIYFGKDDIAKKYLEQWKDQEPASENKDSTLKYAYISLGEYALALKQTKKELSKKKNNWDRASCLESLIGLSAKMDGSQNQEGLFFIKALDQEFKKFNNWKNIGLGRMSIHEGFNYILATNDIDIAKEAFVIVDRWFNEMDSIAYVGLKAGRKAAKKCGFLDKAKIYKKLKIKEKQRIDMEMKK